MSDQYVECQICHHQTQIITGNHVKKHGINLKQYREMFPNVPIQTEQYTINKSLASQRANASRKGVPRTQEVKDKMKAVKKENPKPAWNKGIAKTEEQKVHLSIKKKQMYQSGEIIHWNTGNTTSDETKSKISATAKSQKRIYNQESSEKRLITLKQKKACGWIPPGTRRIGFKVTNLEVLRKIKEVSDHNRVIKKNKSWMRIRKVCDSNNLIIINVVNDFLMTMQCNICRNIFDTKRDAFKPSKQHGQRLCPICYPHFRGRSKQEIDLYEFVKLYYPDAEHSNKTILGGKHLDIFIPSINLAIEFCGLYWHSELIGRDQYYHINKRIKCEEQNIRLITIFGDESTRMSLIKKKILQIIKPKLLDCDYVIESIDNNTKDIFLKKHCLDRSCESTLNLGMYINKLLIAVIIMNNDTLLRCEAIDDYDINDITSIMFNYYIKEYKPECLSCTMDLRWKTPSMLTHLGFQIEKQHTAQYSLLNIDRPNNRLPPTIIYNSKEYTRIWDCGYTTMRWNNPLYQNPS